ERLARCHVFGDPAAVQLAGVHGAFVKQRQVTCRHEADICHGLGMLHVAHQSAIATLHRVRSAAAGRLPLAALPIGALGEVHRVPEFGVDEFGGVVVGADDAASV